MMPRYSMVAFFAALSFSPLTFSEMPSSSSQQDVSFYPLLAQNTFVFYPKKHRWVALKNGKVVRSGRASGGKGYCPDIGRSCRTPVGSYHIQSMGGADCKSSRYPVGRGGAKMPYCMFFTSLYAVHGSYDVPNYNASHGCIRVQPGDAAWLRHHFMQIGTSVVVKPY